MMYQCTYCKTGTMKTAEQYLTHIKATKHKKKAFQLMAPHAGIEYEEFRPKATILEVSGDGCESLSNEPGKTEQCPDDLESFDTVTKEVLFDDGSDENGVETVDSSAEVTKLDLHKNQGQCQLSRDTTPKDGASVTAKIYQCTYCKTGTMISADQYLSHITGGKHKKKVFQLLAPYEGIEYEEFRPKAPGLVVNKEVLESLPIESGNTKCYEEDIDCFDTVTKEFLFDDGTEENDGDTVDSSASVTEGNVTSRARSRSPVPTRGHKANS